MTAIEALEAYSSDHPETIESLLEWPYRRFMRAFDAWQRRRSAERIERQEDAHVAALYANTNMDNPDNNRDQIVRQIQSFYNSLRRQVLGDSQAEVEAPPDPQAEAFFRSSRRNQAMFESPELPGEAAIRRLP